MQIEKITSLRVPEAPPGQWSNALRVGDMLFISGTVSRAADGVTIQGRDEYEQAKIIFGKIRDLVKAAGGTMSDVVKMTIYVVNIKRTRKSGAPARSFSPAIFPAPRWSRSAASPRRISSSRSRPSRSSALGSGKLRGGC